MLIGKHAFSSVEFNGTFFVNTEIDDDYAGIVFNYQSNKRFMLVAWKQSNQSYWLNTPFSAHATAGVQIKVVQSETGPGPMLRNAIWHSKDTPREVRSLTGSQCDPHLPEGVLSFENTRIAVGLA